MKRDELLQTAKPILFNTDMVQAILDGRKTATRRVIKPQPKFILCYTFAGYNNRTWSYPKDSAYVHWGEEYRLPDCITEDDKKMVWKPPYHADDILYVRETWQYIDFAGENNGYVYRASENGKLWETESENWKWRPSIHMPKEAARIFLKVTNVRVERLQDMTIEDSEKEGAFCGHNGDIFLFMGLWNSTIKKSDLDWYGWNSNPWVWVIEFERIEVE